MTIDTLFHYLRHASSFITTWVLCWFALYLLVWALYPGLRRLMRSLHPATASNLLLALMALPLLTSTVATGLVFSPLLEQNWITAHYHSPDCESQFPILKSTVSISAVLGLVGAVLLGLLGKFLSQLLFSVRLQSQLSKLGDQRPEWTLLPYRENLVFTMGLWKNSIFITEGLLKQCTQRELEIILAHERAHASRLDNLRLMLARLLMWLAPATLARKLILDLHLFNEAACDFHTAEQHSKVDVAETLLRVQRLSPHDVSLRDNTLMSAFNGPEVQDRIMLLLGANSARKRKFWPLLYLLVLAVVSLLMVDPLHHAAEWVLPKIQ